MSNNPAPTPVVRDNGEVQHHAWTRFWFTPRPPLGLQYLRVLSGLLFMWWLISLIGHEASFFSLNGWVDREAVIELQQQANMPRFGWSILYLAKDATALQFIYWMSFLVIGLFTLGIATRLTGILTWLVVVSLLANPVTTYEADYLLGVLAFYLMVAHLFLGLWNGGLSAVERVLGSRHDFVFGRWIFASELNFRPPSYAANFFLRLLQIHLAIIMVTNGLHKLQIGDWWSGAAIWYPLHLPFQTSPESLRREAPNASTTFFFLSLIQYGVLAWEIGFPVFAWRRGWGRLVLLGGAALYCLGTWFVFQLPLFGPFVFIGCLAFLTPRGWAQVHQRLAFVWGHTEGTPARQARFPIKGSKEIVRN